MLRTTLLASLLLAGCGDDDNLVGTIHATVYGESFIEDGIPASEVSDGWSITFDSFTLEIGNLEAVAGHDRAPVGLDGFVPVDLAVSSGGAGHALGSFDAPAGTYDHYAYTLRKIVVRGSATKGAVTKTFDWNFGLNIRHEHCEIAEVITDGDATIQATVHADHLFYDDAVSDEPNLAFDLIASADADNDGAITLAELAGVDIRTETRYQTGSLRDPDGATVENLAQYLEVQVGTLGHINGEGHCADITMIR